MSKSRAWTPDECGPDPNPGETREELADSIARQGELQRLRSYAYAAGIFQPAETASHWDTRSYEDPKNAG